MKQFLIQRWFLIALVSVLAIGSCFARQLEPLTEVDLPGTSVPMRSAIVATVLFLMAFPLAASAMWRAMRRPWPPLLAVGVNFGLLPLFAWGVSFGLNADLGGGLLVAAATPCTLASAAVWTRRAGGNDAVAILVTIITNLLCFIVTPLWLLAMTGESVSSPELSLDKMSLKLGSLVVLPMTAAQLLRLYKPLGIWATREKRMVSVLAQCGILAMVAIGAIQTGLRLSDPTQSRLSALDLIAMLAAVCLVHTVMLWVGVGLAKMARFSREDQIAVAFAGSQKTLMVGLLMAISLQVSILPMVAYHISQLFIDTLIADRFRANEPEKPPTV
ncbi:MAG: bile acid:sodium symporter [Planctomycetota bacterium]|nr:bile acid:sodium symporter [Planctomycetota bacterium]